MKTRIISGLIMAPIALLILFFGGRLLLFGCFLVSVVGVHEFYGAFAKSTKLAKPVKPYEIPGILAVSLLYNFCWSWLESGSGYTGWIVLAIFIFLMFLFRESDAGGETFLFRLLGFGSVETEADPGENQKMPALIVTLLGIFYVGFFPYHLVLIDRLPRFGVLIWLVLITAFGTDIMAYFTGYLLGKHKLCPRISPKKTIEGSVGGILGSVLFSGLFGYFAAPEVLVHCLIMGFFGSIVAQLGDLTASIFKRKLGIKDYGNLIPGHGGILDRFDSVLFTAPFVYYYVALFILK